MALTRSDQFEIDLRASLDEERKAILSRLETGGGIGDFAAYQRQVGFLAALRRAEELCDETRAELEKKR